MYIPKAIKDPLLLLQHSLSNKGYGSEITRAQKQYFITIKTTRHTGPISKEQAFVTHEVDKDFLGSGVLSQERLLVGLLEKELNKKLKQKL